MNFDTRSSYRDIGIFDISGKKIRQLDVSDDKLEINVDDLSKGLYLINVNEKGTLVKSLHVVVE